MNRPMFGNRQSAPATHLDRVLIPRGAALSLEQWSMAQALFDFVMVATERALFHVEELPADVVAVFRAYQLAGDLDGKEIDYLFCNEHFAARAGQVVEGLRLIKMDALADVIRSASEAWDACSDQPAEARPAIMKRFATARAGEDGIAARCSIGSGCRTGP